MHQVGAFLHISTFIAFQMGTIFNFDNCDKLHTGNEITFRSLDFVIGRLRTCACRTRSRRVGGGEPPSIWMFHGELEDVVATGAPMLAHHMDLHAQGFFINFGREHILDRVVNFLRGSIVWVTNAG